MPIVFEQPQPSTTAAYGYGELDQFNKNREFELRKAALWQQAMEPKYDPSTSAAIGRASKQDELAFDEWKYRQDRFASPREEYQATVAANLQQNRLDQEVQLMDMKLSWGEQKEMQQSEEGLAAVLGDETLTAQEKEEARQLYGQRLNPLRVRQARADAHHRQLMDQRVQEQLATQTAHERTRMQMLQMSPGDRFSEYMDPQLEQQVVDEMLARSPGVEEGLARATPGFEDEVRREVRRRGGYMRFWTDPSGRPHVLNEGRSEEDRSAVTPQMRQHAVDAVRREIDQRRRDSLNPETFRPPGLDEQQRMVDEYLQLANPQVQRSQPPPRETARPVARDVPLADLPADQRRTMEGFQQYLQQINARNSPLGDDQARQLTRDAERAREMYVRFGSIPAMPAEQRREFVAIMRAVDEAARRPRPSRPARPSNVIDLSAAAAAWSG